ncbi:MAG TPA: hypothetical protein VIO60_05420 [Rectinemataceae bacterium]
MWAFSIRGLDAEGSEILGVDFEADIVSGETTKISVTLEPLNEADGSLRLEVDWSALDTAPSSPTLEIACQSMAEGSEPIYLTAQIDGTSGLATATLTPGYYILGVALGDGSDLAYAWNPQSLRIVSGKETLAHLACDGPGGGTDPDPEADVEMDLSTTSVLRLDFGEADTLTIALKNVPGGRLYLGKANDSTVAALAAGTGGVVAAAGVSGARRGSDAGRGGSELDAASRFKDASVRSYDHPRAQDFEVVPGARSKSLVPPSETIAFGEDDPEMVVGTTTRLFWVESGDGTWIQVQARLRATSDTSYLWIPDANFGNSSTADDDNLLTQAQVTALNEAFNGSGPVGGTGIRALVSNIFSTENGGEPGGDGGIDADQHIHIFLYDIDWDYSASQSGGTLGYFWGKDEYTDAEMQNYGLRSNEAEMFYIDVHFTDGWPLMMVSVLAHEYQHMIHFNQKGLLRGVNSPTWFNEMCSMVSEDFVGSLVGIPDGDSPRARIPRFNGSYYESGVTDWLSGANVLKSYASAYVFGAYLARNYGGAELFNNLLCRSETGPSAVTASLGALGTGTSFSQAFLGYTTAFVFDNPAPNGAYSFPALSSTWGGTTYALPGFSLRDYGTGPVLFEPGTQVGLRPYGHSIHSASAWVDPEENTVIAVEKPDDPDVELYLMYARR